MADYRCHGNLDLSADGALTRLAVTCANILTSIRSSMGHPFAFTAESNTRLPHYLFRRKNHILSFGTMLSPDYFRCKIS